MSKRGVDFLNDWVVEHINPDAYPTENDPRARQYVQECLADAAKSGISRKEIEEDVGNIQGRIIKAMELATDRDGCMLSGARRVHPVIVGWSTANRPLLPKPINDNP